MTAEYYNNCYYTDHRHFLQGFRDDLVLPIDENSEEEEPRQIEVSNVPDVADEEMVKAYFEGTESGGCANAVAECIQIKGGVFLVTFHDPKGIYYIFDIKICI